MIQNIVIDSIPSVSGVDAGMGICLHASLQPAGNSMRVVFPHMIVRTAIEALINGAELALIDRRQAGIPDDDYVPNVFEAKEVSAGPSVSADHVGMIVQLPGGGDVGFQVRRDAAKDLARQLLKWADRNPADVMLDPSGQSH